MSKILAASLSILSVCAVACGNSSPAASTGEPSAKVAAPHAGMWGSAGRAAPAGQVEDELDGPDVVKHAVIEADNVNTAGTTDSDVDVHTSGNGILAFLGNKISTAGECTLYAYATSETGANAGAITVSTSKVSVTLDPSGSGKSVSYADDQPTYPFAEGTVTYSAAGGSGIAAFTGTVKAPKAVAGFTSPTSVGRKKALDLTWTVEAGTMAIYVFGTEITDASESAAEILRCTTKDTGSYSVSTAALALFPKAYNYAEIAVVRYAEKKVTSGEYSVTLLVNQVSEGTDVPFN